MLAQSICQLTFLTRLNLRFGYFCIQNFFIKGYSKFHNVDFEEFSLLECPIGLVLRFCQGVSKNWCIDVTRCLADWHSPSIDYPISNVIETYKEMVQHHPIWPFENLGPHLLFLRPKPRWKPKHDIWFTTTLVGYNQLKLIIDTLTSNFPSLEKNKLSNKNQNRHWYNPYGGGISAM